MFDCCEDLIVSIERNEFKVYPQYRGVSYYFWDESDKRYGEYFMFYCPFCGTEMPKNLSICDETGNDPYHSEIERSVGKEWCDITADEIPAEFKTDEWWKKRGL